MPDQFLPMQFPVRGLDVSRGQSHQKPGTTPVGKNVRVCEAGTMRMRGGARPGVSRFIGQIPEGSVPIQELNVVIISSASALPTGIDDPGTITVDDPSSPGDPSSWGTGTLYTDSDTGKSVTGRDLHSRVPIPPGGSAKRRKGGSGYQPSKNSLTAAPPPGTAPKKLFGGTLTIKLVCGNGDPFHFDGQTPFFVGVECRLYQPPTIPAPSSCQTFASIIAQRDAFLALPTLAPYLLSYTVIGDSVSGPGADCLHVGGQN